MWYTHSRKSLDLNIGVTGDTHNNLKNIKQICSLFNQKRVDLVIHTGDISLPKSLLSFKELSCPLIAVYGNNDIPEQKELKEASKLFDCKIFEEPYSLTLNKKKIIILHHPELIDDEMTLSNDIILHGHTHRYRSEVINSCLVFNPGECAGMIKGKNQIGIVNTEDLSPRIINF